MPSIGNDVITQLSASKRLADLEASGLLDTTFTGALDALTRLTHAALGADTMTLVTAITADSQIVVSIGAESDTGLSDAQMPLSHSLCKYVVINDEPLIVHDTGGDPAYAAVTQDLGMGAYAGFPLRGPRGTVLGAVCAATTEPRQWSASELQILESLAAAAGYLIPTLALGRRERMAHAGARSTDHFAHMQHELRTPLTSLLGLLELLLDGTMGELGDVQLEVLSRCQASADRLREIVETLN